MKKVIIGIAGGISFLLFVILFVVTGNMASSLDEQNMAERWGENSGVAQVSCFFSPDASVTADTFREFEYGLESYLLESSITQESENPGARLWTSTYTAEGKITLSSGYGSLETDALGIGGDFFLFHPYRLLYGSYFSGNDVNQDYCVIDEDAAWQLFGSSDVAGQMVTIGGTPHIITGVIERRSGKLWEAAGLDSSRVYVSLSTLEQYGTSHGINHYEIVMPNPVKEFALNYVKEKLCSDERESEAVENSTRFQLLKRFEVIKAFGTRSMSGKSIIYPYWENVARGYEDIIGMLSVFMILFLAFPAILMILWLRYLWKHKSWTFKGIWIKIIDRMDDFRARRYARKHSKQEE